MHSHWLAEKLNGVAHGAAVHAALCPEHAGVGAEIVLEPKDRSVGAAAHGDRLPGQSTGFPGLLQKLLRRTRSERQMENVMRLTEQSVGVLVQGERQASTLCAPLVSSRMMS